MLMQRVDYNWCVLANRRGRLMCLYFGTILSMLLTWELNRNLMPRCRWESLWTELTWNRIKFNYGFFPTHHLLLQVNSFKLFSGWPLNLAQESRIVQFECKTFSGGYVIGNLIGEEFLFTVTCCGEQKTNLKCAWCFQPTNKNSPLKEQLFGGSMSKCMFRCADTTCCESD